ncbi:PEROXIDASE 72-RELATED [Salix viminalis]|uniref:peroxidase n=1 Tax=Salix viminalis TaxID=40686 RepID=A0A9Q0UV35_SALVM|nr:PEROXIDASE 72-RELATED [Salix viminalis]
MEHNSFKLPFAHLLCLLLLCPLVSCQLNYKFYDYTCPNLTKIVRYGVWSAITNDSRMAASLLRLHFHDCFVNIGGPFWFLPLGRRDGLTTSESDANEQLPGFSEPLENITAKFTSKGLDLKDVAVLSGAHTIGFAQCFTFKSRLFDFGSSGKPDPLLDTSLLTSLQSTCPNQDDSDTKLAPLDSASSSKFDNLYYKLLLNNSGLLQSDQALMGDNTTASLVLNYSKFPYLFFKDFGASMVKMANIGVLTGQNGEIRKNCRLVN